MFEIFLTSSHYWFHVFDVQLYFVCAQRGEMLIFVLLILTLWFWLDFGLRCVGISTLQWVRKFKKKWPFCLHSHAYITPCPFVVPQVCDPLIDCVWHVNIGWLSTNNPTWLQWVSSNIGDFVASSRYLFHAFDVPPLFVGAQRGEMLIIGFLDTNYLVLIGFWYALCWSFLLFSGWENQKEMSLLSALTYVHHPLPLSRTSGMQPTD